MLKDMPSDFPEVIKASATNISDVEVVSIRATQQIDIDPATSEAVLSQDKLVVAYLHLEHAAGFFASILLEASQRSRPGDGKHGKEFNITVSEDTSNHFFSFGKTDIAKCTLLFEIGSVETNYLEQESQFVLKAKGASSEHLSSYLKKELSSQRAGKESTYSKGFFKGLSVMLANSVSRIERSIQDNSPDLREIDSEPNPADIKEDLGTDEADSALQAAMVYETEANVSTPADENESQTSSESNLKQDSFFVQPATEQVIDVQAESGNKDEQEIESEIQTEAEDETGAEVESEGEVSDASLPEPVAEPDWENQDEYDDEDLLDYTNQEEPDFFYDEGDEDDEDDEDDEGTEDDESEDSEETENEGAVSANTDSPISHESNEGAEATLNDVAEAGESEPIDGETSQPESEDSNEGASEWIKSANTMEEKAESAETEKAFKDAAPKAVVGSSERDGIFDIEDEM